ncbi:hypothetical protein GBA63_15740 [Rubrobacter tropicus]|uniref:PRC-barrel domain-containing protein n=1 Tax=Rubrobacter tropicus TaxID=2653851 RepID=A0A6G8QBQ5_9ACTN|nr:PRC-barrel domain-containing protein [Rubrobacter tropicus]QIN83934.1 hypothetical protein GBA63_15740 [Rubrobacter tropicus]
MAGTKLGGDRSVGLEYCKDYGLLDPLGQEVGRVDRVFGNGNGDPQYVRVRVGIFGQRLVLIPVLEVAVDHERRSLTLR